MEISIMLAIIVGFVLFIGLIITKWQTISEFRQAWIDALRSDVFDLISAINYFELPHSWPKIKFNLWYLQFLKNTNDSEGLIKELDNSWK